MRELVVSYLLQEYPLIVRERAKGREKKERESREGVRELVVSYLLQEYPLIVRERKGERRGCERDCV